MSGGRSLVAGANAMFRASESRRPPSSRILDDPFARRFEERDLRVLAVRAARHLLPPLRRLLAELQTVHCVRHRAIDELVLRAVDEGFRQVVVVGAGYDMRPSRFAARLAGVRWLEADHPATAARKRALLERAGDAALPVERVAVDLAGQSLGDALSATAFDASAPACFVLEGLVHYLAPERLDALLGDVARGPGRRRAVLSFIRTDMYERAPGLFVRLVKLVREIPRLHFAPDALAAILARHGLAAFRSWTLAQQIEDFAPAAHGRAAGVSQDVAVATSA